MAQHGIILHSGGDRVLIEPPGFDLSLDNPLLLRRALSFGVKVCYFFKKNLFYFLKFILFLNLKGIKIAFFKRGLFSLFLALVSHCCFLF